MKQIKSIFKNHNASVQEVHVTSDATIFFLKHHAESHASGLEDKRVLTITREQAEAIPDDEETKAEEEAAAAKLAEEEAATKKAEEEAAAAKLAEEEEAATKKAEEEAAAAKTGKKK